MSETRLEKYKKYRQSLNEFKSINNEPEAVSYRDSSIVSDKMNTTSTLPLEEVLGKVEETPVEEPKRIWTKKFFMCAAAVLVGLCLIAGIIIFAIYAFGGQ